MSAAWPVSNCKSSQRIRSASFDGIAAGATGKLLCGGTIAGIVDGSNFLDVIEIKGNCFAPSHGSRIDDPIFDDFVRGPA